MGMNEGSLYIYFNGKIAFLKIADTMEFFFFFNFIYVGKDLERYDLIVAIIWEHKIM